jgi:hypothetical protein
LIVLGVAVVVLPALTYLMDSAPDLTGPTQDSVGIAEARLAKLRAAAASVPAKQEVFKGVSADLAQREKSILRADTAAQSQAQLMQIIRRLGAAENPPVEIRSTELNGIKPLGDNYGEVSVAVNIDCKIDQLVNLLASLPSQPELIASSDLRVISSNTKDKTVNVHMTVSGVVPHRLVPQKPKGSSL